MQWVGFIQKQDGTVTEQLPKSDQMDNKFKRRALFFNLYNFYVERELRLEKEIYMRAATIKEAFDRKIQNMLRGCQRAKKGSFQPDPATTQLIQAYCTNRPVVTSQAPRTPLGKIIQMISGHGGFGLMLDLDDMFLTLVYERIKKVNRGKKVVLGEKEIIIYDPDPRVSPTLVLPFYAPVAQESMQTNPQVTERIKRVKSCLDKGEIRQIFLVFPKSSAFAKHLEMKFADSVRLSDDEYRVKMIPYSFSFCIKNQKRSMHGNRHILRK